VRDQEVIVLVYRVDVGEIREGFVNDDEVHEPVMQRLETPNGIADPLLCHYKGKLYLLSSFWNPVCPKVDVVSCACRR
jgi:hypothetical protein